MTIDDLIEEIKFVVSGGNVLRLDTNQAERLLYWLTEYKAMTSGRHSESSWIPCSERLPEHDGEYLVFTENEDIFKCEFKDIYEEDKWGFVNDYYDPDTKDWEDTWDVVNTVTHWMPLPQPPKEDPRDEQCEP